MKMEKFVVVLVALVGLQLQLCAQVEVPRDTSYTLHSALTSKLKNYPDLEIEPVYSNPSDQIKIKKAISYRIIGERELLANIFYPKKKNKKKHPAILLIHGGGWRTGDKSLMTPIAEKLAEAGFFVMAPEYRLSLEAPFPAAVEDLYESLQWIFNHEKNYLINTKKVIIAGCSAGGQLAALVGTTYNQSGLFQILDDEKSKQHISAIIDIDGVLAFKHPDSKEGDMAAQWLGGTYEEKPEIWKKASALNHVDKSTPPTLFISSKYPRFLAGREDYINKLDKFGIYSETHFFDEAPHSFWLFKPWFEPTIDYILTFLDKVL